MDPPHRLFLGVFPPGPVSLPVLEPWLPPRERGTLAFNLWDPSSVPWKQTIQSAGHTFSRDGTSRRPRGGRHLAAGAKGLGLRLPTAFACLFFYCLVSSPTPEESGAAPGF